MPHLASCERRAVSGLCLPYGVVGRSRGRRYRFEFGTLRLPDAPARIVLLAPAHSRALRLGRALEYRDTPAGLWARFRIQRSPLGDRALAMVADGRWWGLSIGPAAGARFELRAGVWHAVAVPIDEVSLTPHPVFAEARIDREEPALL